MTESTGIRSRAPDYRKDGRVLMDETLISIEDLGDKKVIVADLLKQEFPWLGTDKYANGGDTVEDLAELYARLTRKDQ